MWSFCVSNVIDFPTRNINSLCKLRLWPSGPQTLWASQPLLGRHFQQLICIPMNSLACVYVSVIVIQPIVCLTCVTL